MKKQKKTAFFIEKRTKADRRNKDVSVGDERRQEQRRDEGLVHTQQETQTNSVSHKSEVALYFSCLILSILMSSIFIIGAIFYR